MRDYLDGIGVEIIESGSYEGYARFRKTGIITVFAWTLSDRLPKPEDFILQRSGTTLVDIYRASEWEHPSAHGRSHGAGKRPRPAAFNIKVERQSAKHAAGIGWPRPVQYTAAEPESVEGCGSQRAARDSFPRAAELRLRPGMPVEAFIQTGARSPASYLLKPFTDYLDQAFREE